MTQANASVGLFEAKTHLSALIERVARGESIAITKHGRPMAVMVPPEKKAGPDAGRLWAEYKRMARGARLGRGETIRDLINEGRR